MGKPPAAQRAPSRSLPCKDLPKSTDAITCARKVACQGGFRHIAAVLSLSFLMHMQSSLQRATQGQKSSHDRVKPTVVGALELHVELADIVVDELNLPVAHHSAGKKLYQAPDARAQQPRQVHCLLRGAHSFITSISRRLLGLAIPSPSRTSRAPLLQFQKANVLPDRNYHPAGKPCRRCGAMASMKAAACAYSQFAECSANVVMRISLPQLCCL